MLVPLQSQVATATVHAPAPALDSAPATAGWTYPLANNRTDTPVAGGHAAACAAAGAPSCAWAVRRAGGELWAGPAGAGAGVGVAVGGMVVVAAGRRRRTGGSCAYASCEGRAW